MWEWSELDRALGQHAGHQAASNEVAQAIGVSRQMRPREVVKKLVGYYRAFTPSDDPPRGRSDIFLDLALSKKGVCRHRAFAFLVTALGLGVPARMVVNEAHALGRGLRREDLGDRIDLGGAAANLDFTPETNKPSHIPPPDPYSWPEQRDSGQDAADRARQRTEQDAQKKAEQQGDAPTASARASASASASASAAPSSTASTDPPEPEDPAVVEAFSSVGAIDKVTTSGAACPFISRVWSRPAASLAHTSASTWCSPAPRSLPARWSARSSTDEKGRYDGRDRDPPRLRARRLRAHVVA